MPPGACVLLVRGAARPGPRPPTTASPRCGPCIPTSDPSSTSVPSPVAPEQTAWSCLHPKLAVTLARHLPPFLPTDRSPESRQSPRHPPRAPRADPQRKGTPRWLLPSYPNFSIHANQYLCVPASLFHYVPTFLHRKILRRFNSSWFRSYESI